MGAQKHFAEMYWSGICYNMIDKELQGRFHFYEKC